MATTRIKEATEAGRDAVRAFLEETYAVEDRRARRARAMAMIEDPSLFREVPGAGEIDLDARFATALDFVRHVAPAIDPLGPAGIRNKGVILFLYMAYVDQLVKETARVVDTYFIDERSKGGTSNIRNYRNAVFVHLWVFNLHRNNDMICGALLGSAPGVLNNACDRVAQSNVVIGSAAMLEVVIRMFFDPRKGGYRKLPKGGPRQKPKKNVQNAMKELAAIVFKQCALNYDIGRMSARQLFRLVPSTPGLKPYKKFAEESFADEGSARAA